MPQSELREPDPYPMEPLLEESVERHDGPFGEGRGGLTLIAPGADAVHTANWDSIKESAKHGQPHLESDTQDWPYVRQVFPEYLFRIDTDDRIIDVLRGSTSPFALPLTSRRAGPRAGLDTGYASAFWDAVYDVRRTGMPSRIEHMEPGQAQAFLYEIWIAPTLTNDLVGIVRDVTASRYAANVIRAGAQATQRAISNLWNETQRLEAERDKLLRLATYDSLTGLWNRRAILDLLSKALAGALREIRPVTVIMADLDQFKSINDRFGHQIGDAVLREAGRCFRSCVRRSDEVGRYGGEEFLIVLPGCDAEAAVSRAEEFRAAISGKPFQVAGLHLAVTCSLGLYSVFGAGYDCDQVIRKADAALYQAKRSGRNRVEIAE